MNKILKAEEWAQFAAAWWVAVYLGYSHWIFLAFLFTPDISMLGYLFNTRAGAFLYNFFHHKALAVIVTVSGLWLQNSDLQFVGIILFAHSSLDRALGYGLKYADDFQHTHLGWIGKMRKKDNPGI